MRSWAFAAIVLAVCSAASAQSSSIGRRQPTDPPAAPLREAVTVKGNPLLERHSLIAVKETEPRKFKVNDLITIIVRERTIYEAEGEANTKRQADFKSELDAFINFTGGGIGAAAFRRGKPNINYKASLDQKNDADMEREDKLTTRLTAKIIDVKPNGNLVFEARKQVEHDDECHIMTLTGACRSVDVTPDNSLLSTQVADLRIKIDTKGSIRNTTRSGWFSKIYDRIRPL